METNHKTFKPFDKVIVKVDTNIWHVDLYSSYHEATGGHQTLRVNNGCSIHDDWILPYEGNEHLVGTSDDPDEEVKLKRGEFCFFADNPDMPNCRWSYGSLKCINNDTFASTFCWKYAVRFFDFNPDKMWETRKHILCVKNGRIIRYKD